MAGERTTIELAAEIAAAFVSNNSVRPADLPALIGDIHGALQRFSSGEAAVAEPEKLTPAVSIKKSVGDDYIICLEDGRKFKSLKRHLRTAYNLSPDEYRAKWGLPQRLPDGRAGVREGAFGARAPNGARPEAAEGAEIGGRHAWVSPEIVLDLFSRAARVARLRGSGRRGRRRQLTDDASPRIRPRGSRSVHAAPRA